MLKMDNWGPESLEAPRVTLGITGAGPHGAKALVWGLCGPHGPCLLPLSPKSGLGSFQKTGEEGGAEASMGILCWIHGIWV